MQIRQENVSLQSYTTLGLGGSARFLTVARDESDISETFLFADTQKLPVFVLGGGSNLVVSDNGFSGVVLQISLKGESILQERGSEVRVTAAAGQDWDDFVAFCVDKGLSGVECLSGIPGRVGGTPVQNVGAYGQEVSQTITGVRAYDTVATAFVELSAAECGFGYRQSIFNTSAYGRYVIVAVTYALPKAAVPNLAYRDLKAYFAEATEAPTLAQVRAAVLEIRGRKGMVIQPGDPDCQSAGSFFKNPVVSAEQLTVLEETQGKIPAFPQGDGTAKVPAAWLIENAGFTRGYRRGNVGLSTKHTLALTNRGGGTATELVALMREIQEGVCARFGLALQPEPVFLGFAPEEIAPFRCA